jgi:hypothetical protein
MFPNPLSPLGDAKHQQDDGGCEETVSTGVRNVTKLSSPPSNATYPSVPKNEQMATVPELPPVNSATEQFHPTYLGTAKEEDLMNGVRSHYSSLMPKGGDLRTDRPEEFDPPAPLPEDLRKEMEFKPRDPHAKQLARSLPPNVLEPEVEVYSSSQMEIGVPLNSHVAEDSTVYSPLQKKAMANAQYQSPSIYSPPLANPTRTTKEHSTDKTGNDRAGERLLDARDDEQIIEGWEVKDVHMDTAQMKIGVSDGVPGPEPAVSTVDLREQAAQEIRKEVQAETRKLEQLAQDQGTEVPKEVPLALTTPIS